MRMEIVRYGVNGVAATMIHYSILYYCVEFINFQKVGVANFFASSLGIATSFIGNKYFVFDKKGVCSISQAIKFIALYFLIALVHGLLLHFWVDIYGRDYNTGFVIAVLIQFALGYAASKFIVFREVI